MAAELKVKKDSRVRGCGKGVRWALEDNDRVRVRQVEDVPYLMVDVCQPAKEIV